MAKAATTPGFRLDWSRRNKDLQMSFESSMDGKDWREPQDIEFLDQAKDL
jgi:hypothetical protein